MHADLATPCARLREALANLQVHWDEARERWRDPVSTDFEERRLDPLEPKVGAAIKALERLSRTFAQAERECR